MDSTALWATAVDRPGEARLWQLRMGRHRDGRYSDVPVGKLVPEEIALELLRYHHPDPPG